MKGVYCLIISLSKNINLPVGALGKIFLRRGAYIYVGSAQNNVKKRVERHLKKNKKKHWHIDYLIANRNTTIKKVLWKEAKKEEECKIAGFVKSIGDTVKGFGCSDCKCKSHLFRLKSEFNPKGLQEL